MFLTAMIAATLFMADTPVAADAAKTAAPPAKTETAKAEKPKMVCRTEAVTGSMFPKKVCYNVEQQAQSQQDQRANLEKVQGH